MFLPESFEIELGCRRSKDNGTHLRGEKHQSGGVFELLLQGVDLLLAPLFGGQEFNYLILFGRDDFSQ